MNSTNSPYQTAIADLIRDEIAKIPDTELGYAKPSRILPSLEKAGIEITASVRSATSKLLGKAKKKAGYTNEGDVMFEPTFLQTKENNSRQELAMRLIEACNGNFEAVRAEIARLEQFAKKIMGNKSVEAVDFGFCLDHSSSVEMNTAIELISEDSDDL
jgi:hypothetical protein